MSNSHWHIMIRDTEQEDKPFVSLETSFHEGSLYEEFRHLHDTEPDKYRFGWCNSKDCYVPGWELDGERN